MAMFTLVFSGCPPQISPDVPTGPGSCCCENIFFPLAFLCEDTENGRAYGGVSNIQIDDQVTLSPGVITQFDLSGGRDIDIAFPSDGGSWYEECPGDCGEPCEEGAAQPNSICYVIIENRNRLYDSEVTGYIDSYETFYFPPDRNVEEKFLSRHVYFGVDSRYPVQSGVNAIVNLSTSREGAVYQELNGINEATFANRYPVTQMPTRYKVRYAAHQNVTDADTKMAEVMDESSFKARQRLSDDPTAIIPAVLQRSEDQRDMHLNVHFEVERVPDSEIGIELPIEIDCCTEAGRLIWDDTRRLLLSKNIHVLVVKKLWAIPAGETECIEVNGRADLSGRYMVLSTSSPTFARTFLHELGHNCGLDHVPDDRLYNVMNVSMENYGADRGMDIASYQDDNYQDEDSGIYFPKL